jgi:hypothetical protein
MHETAVTIAHSTQRSSPAEQSVRVSLVCPALVWPSHHFMRLTAANYFCGIPNKLLYVQGASSAACED